MKRMSTKKNTWGGGTLRALLAFVLVLGLAPAVPVAYAAEEVAPESADEIADSVDAVHVSDANGLMNAVKSSGTVILDQPIALGSGNQITIGNGVAVTLDLKGDNLSMESSIIVDGGSLTVMDSDTTSGPTYDENNNYSVSYTAGSINTPGTTISVKNGGSFILKSGILRSTAGGTVDVVGNTAPNNNDPISSVAIIDGGYQVGQEGGPLAVGNGAHIIVNDGIIEGTDNTPLSGNGTVNGQEDKGGYTIDMAGGVLIARITTDDYASCGIYHPNWGTVNVFGGTIISTNGPGIVSRAGVTNVTGGTIIAEGSGSGWVGDSKADKIAASGIVYDAKAEYPGTVDKEPSVSVCGKVDVKSTAASVDFIPATGQTDANAPIEVTGGTFSPTFATDFLPSGMTFDTNGAVVIDNEKAVAEADGVGFDKLQEAVEYAVKNNIGIVTLTQNTAENVTIPAGANLVIDGNGNTLTGSATCAVATDSNAAEITTELTLNNLVLNKGTGAADYGIVSQNQSSTTVSGLSLTMNGCTVSGYTKKGIYLTNAVALNIDNCLFKDNAAEEMDDPNTYGDYTIDLNLMNVDAGDFVIKNSTFEGVCGAKAAIKVSARGGASDTWSGQDIPEGTQTSVKSLTISGCTFNDSPAAVADVNIGTDSKADSNNSDDKFETNATGNFAVTISDNKTPVVVNPAYLSYKSTDGKYYLANGNGKTPVENIIVPAGRTAIKTETGNLEIYTPSKPVTPPSKPSYSVSVSDTENGTVTVSPTSAKEGTKVTVTVKPDLGYELEKLAVTDASGKTVETTEQEDGTYTFAMPGSKVTVAAAFADAWENPFADVSESDWFYGAVREANLLGLMDGYEGTTLFGPADGLTRAQAAKVMWVILGGGDLEAPDAPQADVDQSQWYAPYVNWAVDSGVMDGYSEETFGVGDTLTREQFAETVAKAAKADLAAADQSALDAFPDADGVSEWARPAVAWAVESGVIGGVETDGGERELQPVRTVTRAEMAKMIVNAIGVGVLDYDA